MTPRKPLTLSPAAALAEARALLAQREDEYYDAQAAAEEFTDILRSGDDSISADDLTGADNGIKRAALLLDAARRALRIAENEDNKARARQSPVLAEMLRDIIEENIFDFGLFGFPVEVVPEFPKEVNPPAVYLTQQTATEANYISGYIGGTVEIAVVVPTGVSFTTDRIESALDKWVDHPGIAQVQAIPSSRTASDGECRTVQVILKYATEQIPVINETGRQNADKDFARSLKAGIVQSGQTRDRGVVIGNGWSTGQLSDMHADVTAGQVQQTNNDGKVRRVVEVVIVASGLYPLDILARRVNWVIEQSKGSFASALGRVEEVTTSAKQPTIGEHGHKHFHLDARFTFISKTPSE